MIAVRKSIGLKNQSRQLATPGHVISAHDIVQRCLSLLVWFLGVDYVLCTSCTAGSKGHRLFRFVAIGVHNHLNFWGHRA